MSLFSNFLSWLRGEPPANDPDEREAFALRLGALLQATGQELRFDREQYAFVDAEGRIAFLNNHWDTWRVLDEEHREAFLLEVAGHISRLGEEPETPPDDWEEAAPNVLPRIRPAYHRAIVAHELARHGQGPPPSEPAWPLANHLVVQLVYDTPSAIVSLSHERLAIWGVTPDEALDQAMDNLLESTDIPFVSYEEGVFVAEVDDCYDSSRVLLIEVIEQLPLQGRPVALPANRDTLFITGEHDYNGLQTLLTVASRALDMPRLDTVAPVVLQGERWHPWLPPPEHPHHAEWAELVLRDRGSAYGAVKALLEARLEKEGEDRFVASFGALVIEGVPRSYTTWAPVRAFLPRTELIAIAKGEDPDAGFLLVPWETVVELAPERFVAVPEVEPPFFAVEGGADPELVAALAEHDIG